MAQLVARLTPDQKAVCLSPVGVPVAIEQKWKGRNNSFTFPPPMCFYKIDFLSLLIIRKCICCSGDTIDVIKMILGSEDLLK